VTVDTRRTFHTHLDEIRGDIVRLAAAVTERIPAGTLTVLAPDAAAAQALIDADDELDALALSIEDRCHRELTLQQPMASDMRVLVTAIRLASEIERSGDLVVNVAKASLRIAGEQIDPRVRGLLQRMSDEAVVLFRHAVDAYIDGDEVAAGALDRMDDALDAVHRHYIARVLDSCRDGFMEIHVAVQLALVGRYYERIGDHAVNIGERVQYMVTGSLAPMPR